MSRFLSLRGVQHGAETFAGLVPPPADWRRPRTKMIGVVPLSVAKAPLLYTLQRLHQAVILAAIRFDPARQLTRIRSMDQP